MLETLLFALGLNIAMFLIAFVKKTDKLTDISYAATFVGIALYGAVTNDMSVVKWLAVSMVVLWAFRLGLYLLVRIHAMGRDKRFDDRRNNFWKFGSFWVLQAITAWIVMLPVTLLLRVEDTTVIEGIGLEFFMALGVAIFLCGLAVEAVADAQKFAFIQDKKNKGKWIEQGLWKYSRHPNYFGEMTVWWGVYVYCGLWLGSGGVLVALASPLFITTMLLFVSGVPLLEKSADKKWGKSKKYQDYKRRTHMVVPLPNKHS